MAETMKYLSVEETALKWGKTPRNVRIHCQKGHIPGAILVKGAWRIPSGATDPAHTPRRKVRPSTVLAILKAEKASQMKGGLYHRLQIDFAFNSNHMEGSTLTREQTKWIFETQTVGALAESTPVDDIIEARNHFRCLDLIIETAGAKLTEAYIKRLHALLKSGTSDALKGWFAVGDYKRLENVVGDSETCPVSEVPARMAELLRDYAVQLKTLESIIDFHVRFESIHPFQDGNGRIGRLLMLKECLKAKIMPFVIAEGFRQFYYLGLKEWRQGRPTRLLEVCRTGQDVFQSALDNYIKKK